MLDHVGLAVADLARSRDFYLKVLAPLGYGLVLEIGPDETGGVKHVGFGSPGRPFFWIGAHEVVPGPIHIAFAADSQATVAAFYEAALAAGARDNGPPGLRTQYHPDYYAAFVFDPDGHNIEAVCHKPG